MENHQPNRYDIWASNILFFSAGLSVVMNYFTKKGFFASNMSTSAHLGLYGGTAFMLGLFYYLRTGVRGVKISFLLIYGLAVLNVFMGGWIAKTCTTPLSTFDFVSQYALQLMASVLLIMSLIKAHNTALTAEEIGASTKRQ